MKKILIYLLFILFCLAPYSMAASTVGQFKPTSRWGVSKADNGYEYLDFQFTEIDKTHTKVVMSVIVDAGLSRQEVIDEIKKVESDAKQIPLSKISGVGVSIDKATFDLESLSAKEFIITHPEKLVDGWEIKIGTASATITTTTNTLSIGRGSVRYIHYANGYYWAFIVRAAAGDRFVDVFSSSDGTTWNEQGSGPVKVTHYSDFAARFDGNNVITVGLQYNDTTRYRQGVLESDGTITWGTERNTAESGNTGGLGGSGVQKDATGKPWVAIYDVNENRFESNFNSANDGSGSWTLDTLARPVATDNYPNVTLFVPPDTSEKMLMIVGMESGKIRESLNNGTDWNDPFTEVATDCSTTQTMEDYGMSSVQMANDEIHTVYITSSGAIKHIKRSGSTPWAWSDVDTDITSLTSHTKLSLGRDGSDLYVFYDKGDEKIYYRQFTSGSWGSESTLKSGTDVILGAISCYEASANSEIGVIWVQDTGGGGSPYDVKFDTISIGGAPPTFIPKVRWW